MIKSLTPNTLPEMPTLDERYVSLPFHVFDVETHECIHCGQAPIWDTFAEYVAHFFAHEYEGEQYHTHDEEDVFDWFASSCMGDTEHKPRYSVYGSGQHRYTCSCGLTDDDFIHAAYAVDGWREAHGMAPATNSPLV